MKWKQGFPAAARTASSSSHTATRIPVTDQLRRNHRGARMSDDWQTVPSKNARQKVDNGWPTARQRSAAPPSSSQVNSSKNHAGSGRTQMPWGEAAANLATSQAMKKPAAPQSSSDGLPDRLVARPFSRLANLTDCGETTAELGGRTGRIFPRLQIDILRQRK